MCSLRGLHITVSSGERRRNVSVDRDIPLLDKPPITPDDPPTWQHNVQCGHTCFFHSGVVSRNMAEYCSLSHASLTQTILVLTSHCLRLLAAVRNTAWRTGSKRRPCNTPMAQIGIYIIVKSTYKLQQKVPHEKIITSILRIMWIPIWSDIT